MFPRLLALAASPLDEGTLGISYSLSQIRVKGRTRRPLCYGLLPRGPPCSSQQTHSCLGHQPLPASAVMTQKGIFLFLGRTRTACTSSSPPQLYQILSGAFMVVFCSAERQMETVILSLMCQGRCSEVTVCGGAGKNLLESLS